MTTYGTIPTTSIGGTNVEYLSRAKARIKSGLGTRRPWKEMFNLHSFSLPRGVYDAFSRIKTNVGYFRMNYAILMLIIIFMSLLWLPISLIVFVVMMAAWLFLYFLRDEPLVIMNRTIDDRTVLIVLSILTIVVLLLTGATWNIISSVLIGAAVVVVHAAIRSTDDLLLDDGGETGGYIATSSS
ncbi:PRA1 family protein F3-like [Rutidosis leptorrhynchoides]|uniref:PRA1 family protein F3-like n=1 Tax=Rutidosis leptorrhynchoides TaxID=125765 RepID=UPI003A9A58E7